MFVCLPVLLQFFFFLIVKCSVLKYEVLDAVPDANKEFDCSVPPITIDPSQFHGSLHKAKDETDSNCWTSPGGKGFMIRGKTYLKDNAKVVFAFLLNHWPLFESLSIHMLRRILSFLLLCSCKSGFGIQNRFWDLLIFLLPLVRLVFDYYYISTFAILVQLFSFWHEQRNNLICFVVFPYHSQLMFLWLMA